MHKVLLFLLSEATLPTSKLLHTNDKKYAIEIWQGGTLKAIFEEMANAQPLKVDLPVFESQQMICYSFIQEAKFNSL